MKQADSPCGQLADVVDSHYLVGHRALEGVPRRRIRLGSEQHRYEAAHVVVVRHVAGGRGGVVLMRRVVRRVVRVVWVVRSGVRRRWHASALYSCNGGKKV